MGKSGRGGMVAGDGDRSVGDRSMLVLRYAPPLLKEEGKDRGLPHVEQEEFLEG